MELSPGVAVGDGSRPAQGAHSPEVQTAVLLIPGVRAVRDSKCHLLWRQLGKRDTFTNSQWLSHSVRSE